jgi:hypothetical protein
MIILRRGMHVVTEDRGGNVMFADRYYCNQIYVPPVLVKDTRQYNQLSELKQPKARLRPRWAGEDITCPTSMMAM